MFRFYITATCLSLILLGACAQQDLRGLSPSSGSAEQEAAPATEGGEHAAPVAEGAAAGAHGEKKKTEMAIKPKADSVISSVLGLPVVRKWGEWMDAKGDGSKIVAWGEYTKAVKGRQCWSIVVAEENAKGNSTKWKRFCMEQSGLEMWVESALGAQNTDESNYITYEKWMSDCKPTYNSPGIC